MGGDACCPKVARLDCEQVGALRPLSASEGDRFAELLQKRRAAILQTIEKEEKRLAGRPLQGQRFADAQGVVRIEFRDRTRAYLVSPGGGTVEANWEQDGQRVVLRHPTVNTVLERQGATLVGAGTTLWPVPED